MEASLDGSHPVVQRILRLTEKLATSRVPVLIVGEDGSGRETLARVIHCRGKMPGRFVALDCRPLGENDAKAHEPLRRALAGSDGEDIGTLFLREVGALPEELQHDLAEALLDNGSKRPLPRVIASTRGEPQRGGQADRLCEALCDALLRVTLILPPLRERRSDVPGLVQKILEHRVARGEPPCRVTTEAMVHLWEHDWPGNVRELKNLIDRLAAASRDGLIHAEDLPPSLRRSAPAERRPAISIRPGRLRFAS